MISCRLAASVAASVVTNRPHGSHVHGDAAPDHHVVMQLLFALIPWLAKGRSGSKAVAGEPMSVYVKGRGPIARAVTSPNTRGGRGAQRQAQPKSESLLIARRHPFPRAAVSTYRFQRQDQATSDSRDIPDVGRVLHLQPPAVSLVCSALGIAALVRLST